MISEMDLDLADYDQVDEAKFFMSQRLGLSDAAGAPGASVVALSSSCEHGASQDEANCENDFVFLPPAPTEQQQQQQQQQQPRQASDSKSRGGIAKGSPQDGGGGGGGEEATAAAGQRQASQRLGSLPPCIRHPTSLPLTRQAEEAAAAVAATSQPGRASHPLMTINPNASAGKNPFYNLHQMSPDSASSQAYQPFWMRPETFASKPIGLLEINSANVCSPNHLSDLMHQIITKSDSIYIAIPCAYCHEPKACPPSDISAWLNHMNRVHNCKVCPICNKLVGLGPMRDLEIMRKHVVAHIDDDWLERRSAKTNFSFGLQQQWFLGGRCSVKDPRSAGIGFKK